MTNIARIRIKEKKPGFDLIFSSELKTSQDVIPKFEISILYILKIILLLINI